MSDSIKKNMTWPLLMSRCLGQDQNTGKLFADEAASMYERAITTILKSNMLNHFAYADFEEVSHTSLAMCQIVLML